MGSATETLETLGQIVETVRSDGIVTVKMLLEASDALAHTGLTVDTLEEEDIGPEITPLEAIEDVAFGAPAAVLFVLAILVFIVLIILTLVSNWVGGVPGAGSFLSSKIDDLATTVARLVNDLVHELETLVSDSVKGFKRLLRWFVSSLGFQTETQVTKLITSAVKPVVADYRTLLNDIEGINKTLYHGPGSVTTQVTDINKDLKYINSELGRLWAKVNDIHGTPGGTSGSEIDTLKHEIATLRHSVTAIENELAKPEPKSPVTKARIAHDESRISEVETTTQRLQREIDKLQTTHPSGHGLTQHQQTLLNELAKNMPGISVLLGLLPLTAMEIGNLRKLADDPCYCVNNFSVPDPLVDALLVDQVIAHGI